MRDEADTPLVGPSAGSPIPDAQSAAAVEQTGPNVEERAEDQQRAREASAYSDPITAMPIA